MDIIQVDRLVKRYGSFTAVDGVSFEVHILHFLFSHTWSKPLVGAQRERMPWERGRLARE